MPHRKQVTSVAEFISSLISSEFNTIMLNNRLIPNNSTEQSSKNGELTEGDIAVITTFSILVPLVFGVSILCCYLAAKRNKKTTLQKQTRHSILSDRCYISYDDLCDELQDTETPTIQEIDNTSFNENKTTISTINENQSLNSVCGLESNKTNESLLQNTNTKNKKEHQYEEIALYEDPMQLTECSAEVLAEQEESIAI